MNHQRLRVDALRKIGVSIEAGQSPEAMDLTTAALELDFIFGIGTGGISPFEYALVNRRSGERITVPVRRKQGPAFFGHLSHPILRHVGAAGDFYLAVRITGVSLPENREVVRAMAETAGCGPGCDCGCSCEG